MTRWEPIDWWILLAGPLGVMLLALPFVAALCQLTAARPAADWAWVTPVERADRALAEGDAAAAQRAWIEAYGAAIRARTWEPMIEVGDLMLRIGDAAGTRQASLPPARQAYLIALFRARQDGALDGIVRAAEAFAALGDREVVEHALQLAGPLAERSAPEAYRGVVERLRDRALAANVVRHEAVR